MHIIYISHAHINHQNASYAHLSKKEEYGDVILPDNPFHNSRSLDRLDISLTDQPTIEAFHILHFIHIVRHLFGSTNSSGAHI